MPYDTTTVESFTTAITDTTTETELFSVTNTNTVVQTDLFTVTNVDTQVQTNYITSSVTNTGTVTVPTTLVESTTATVTVTKGGALKRGVQLDRRDTVTVIPTSVPSYAWSACHSDVASYVYACSCVGATTSTLSVTPSATVTVTVTNTATTTNIHTESTTETDLYTQTISTSITETDQATVTIGTSTTATVLSTTTQTTATTTTQTFEATATTLQTVTRINTATQTVTACGATPTNFYLLAVDGPYAGQYYYAANKVGAYALYPSTTQKTLFQLDSQGHIFTNDVTFSGRPAYLAAPSGNEGSDVILQDGLGPNAGGGEAIICTRTASTNAISCAIYGMTHWSIWFDASDGILSLARDGAAPSYATFFDMETACA